MQLDRQYMSQLKMPNNNVIIESHSQQDPTIEKSGQTNLNDEFHIRFQSTQANVLVLQNLWSGWSYVFHITKLIFLERFSQSCLQLVTPSQSLQSVLSKSLALEMVLSFFVTRPKRQLGSTYTYSDIVCLTLKSTIMLPITKLLDGIE